MGVDEQFPVANSKRKAEPGSGPSSSSTTADPVAPVVVVGLGSPHGDDQVGWRVIELLQRQENLPAKAIVVREGSDLVTNLEGCRRLIIIDACRSGSQIGSITQLRWPDPQIVEDSHRSMHGMTASQAMRLAEQLGRVPASVEVFAVEIGECLPGRGLSPAVLDAAIEVESLILTELREEAYA